MSKLSDHFDSSEFRCRCGCGAEAVDPHLVALLEVLRTNAGGKPIKITSGRRCPDHNAAVGGKSSSAHLTGEAADIYCEGSDRRMELVTAALIAGFKRIGIARHFIHVDVSTNLPQRMLWLY